MASTADRRLSWSLPDLAHGRLSRPGVATAAALGALAAFAVWIELRYGRLGYLPLDNSIIFDGGWRTVSGQLPFRDYTTPNGITPILLQGLFFRIFGVTWFAYCLHAAVVNALFAWVAYWLLRLLDLPRLLAFAYALASAVVLYPPIGTPLMGQHSFFLLLLAAALAVAGLQAEAPRRQVLFLALVPPVGVLALLSKQQPAGYGLVVVGLLLLTARRADVRRIALALAGGALATAVALAAVVAAAGIDLGLFREYWLSLPSGIGRERLSDAGMPRALGRRWGLWTPWVAYAGVLGAGVLLAVRGRLARTAKPTRALVLAGGFIVVTELYVALTFNEPPDGWGLFFVILGLLHVAARSAVAPSRVAVVAVAVVLLGVALADAWRVNQRVNVTRMLNNLTYASPTAAQEDALPKQLRFLRWSVPVMYGETAEDFGRTEAYLEHAPGNFLLFGDSSILYGLTGRPSTAPILWLHWRLTYPAPPSRAFDRLERRYLANIRRYDVRRIVLEHVAMGSRLGDFPLLDAYVARHRCGVHRFGGFTIVELCHESAARAPAAQRSGANVSFAIAASGASKRGAPPWVGKSSSTRHPPSSLPAKPARD